MNQRFRNDNGREGRRVWTVSVSLVVVALTTASASALPFRISVYSPDGTELNAFDVTFEDMHIDMVKMGPDGNIWLARSDNSHGAGSPNPNDMVAVYTMDGVEVTTIAGGGMRHPLAVAWDGDGNIYISGEDNFFASDIYKYDAGGGFLDFFHTDGWTLIDEYNDIVVTNDDRIYATSWHGTGSDHQMTEFDTSGATVQTFSPTGPSYFHRDAALDPSGTIWVRTPKNGSGDDLLREFDLSGNELGSFSTTAAIPDSNLRGLEVTDDGHLWVMESATDTLYELDANGNVVSDLLLEGLSDWITDFTFGPDGEIIVANESVPALPCEGDANGDGVVDPLDSGYVLARFGCEVGPGNFDCNHADQNHDGVVDPLDVGFILARFGQCP